MALRTTYDGARYNAQPLAEPRLRRSGHRVNRAWFFKGVPHDPSKLTLPCGRGSAWRTRHGWLFRLACISTNRALSCRAPHLKVEDKVIPEVLGSANV